MTHVPPNGHTTVQFHTVQTPKKTLATNTVLSASVVVISNLVYAERVTPDNRHKFNYIYMYFFVYVGKFI